MNKMSEIIIKNEVRPCYAQGRRALFHGWSHVSKIHNAVLRGTVSGVISDTFAIVEFEDGNISRIEPEHIRFADNLFDEYYFKGNEVEE